MAGYSGTPLAKKLGIKQGAHVAWCGEGPGPGILAESLPDDVALERSLAATRPFDVIVLFLTAHKQLVKELPQAQRRLDPAGGLWLAWPKKSSGAVTDLTEDQIREVALTAGLVDNKVCAIDETWSGLRCVVRLADRPKAQKARLEGERTEAKNQMKPKKKAPAKAKPAAKPSKPAPKATSENHLERIRALCLAYPESTEVVAWGHPTFRVRDKIFASTGFDGTTLGVKATHEQQADLVSSDPRFQIADYVGKHGWVTMSLAGKVDFGFVKALIAESYRLVAPKTLGGAAPAHSKTKSAKKATAKKTSAKKAVSTKAASKTSTSAKKASSTRPSPTAPQKAPKASAAKLPSRGKLVKASSAKQR